MEAPVDDAGLATISDYDVAQDQLVVMYDPAAFPDPDLTVEHGDDGQSSILLNGKVLAMVQGSPLSVADIRLVATAA